MKKYIVFEYGGANPFVGATAPSMITVTQRQSGARLFTVTYGLQVKGELPYSDAARELGECLLHFLCCEGLASNDEGK